MGFAQAISAGFSNPELRHRACRSEYWYWILFIVIADIVAGIIDAVLGIRIVTGLFGLVTIIPNIAIAIRRLHDLDRTGWWNSARLHPADRLDHSLDLVRHQGHRRPNRFGPDPLATLAIPAAPRAA